MMEPEYHDLVLAVITRMLSQLPDDAHHVLISFWAGYEPQALERLAQVFQQYITMRLLQGVCADEEDYCPNHDEVLTAAVECLGIVCMWGPSHFSSAPACLYSSCVRGDKRTRMAAARTATRCPPPPWSGSASSVCERPLLCLCDFCT